MIERTGDVCDALEQRKPGRGSAFSVMVNPETTQALRAEVDTGSFTNPGFNTATPYVLVGCILYSGIAGGPYRIETLYNTSQPGQGESKRYDFIEPNRTPKK
jgi:hypothetical protein